MQLLEDVVSLPVVDLISICLGEFFDFLVGSGLFGQSQDLFVYVIYIWLSPVSIEAYPPHVLIGV